MTAEIDIKPVHTCVHIHTIMLTGINQERNGFHRLHSFFPIKQAVKFIQGEFGGWSGFSAHWNPLAVQQKASNTNSIPFTPSEPFQPLLWDAEGSLGWITALDLGGQSPRTRTVSRRVGELKSIEGRAEGESGALASNQLTGTRWMDTDRCRAVINFTDIYKSS